MPETGPGDPRVLPVAEQSRHHTHPAPGGTARRSAEPDTSPGGSPAISTQVADEAPYVRNLPSPGELLEGLARSFVLSLRLLPPELRGHFARAYLFARAGDTVADTPAVPEEERDRWLGILEEAAARLAQGEPIVLEAPPLGPGGGRYERGLMARLPVVAEWVSELEVPARKRAGWVCGILFGAMRHDLARFGLRSDEIIALPDEQALEDYLYGNAGCVGAYWAHELGVTSPRFTALDLQSLERAGIRLGNALQRVNVLRDLASDLRRGRCYLPADAVGGLGLELRDLYSTAVAPRLQPLLEQQIEAARRDLERGMEFFHVLPRRWVRSRAAAALPAVLARRTLDRIQAQPARLLNPEDTVKVPRSEVQRIIARLLIAPPSDRGLERMVTGRPAS